MEIAAIRTLIEAIANWIKDRDSYLTKTKLLKLLYLFDLEFFRAHGKTFTGFSWKFFHLGPWAAEYDDILQGLLADQALSAQFSQAETAAVL